MRKAVYFTICTIALSTLFSFTNSSKWSDWSRSYTTGYRGVTYQYRFAEKKGEYELQLKIRNTSGHKISHCIAIINGEANGFKRSTSFRFRYLDNGFDQILTTENINWSSQSWNFNFDIE